jgi:dipeptidyl aminopeptidase/acylaminoacyl peptidase
VQSPRALSRPGDLKADRTKLETASPIRMVDRFKAPVLLIHGDGDPIVSVDQSRKMKEALKHAGKSVRYVELPDVGHAGWTRETEGRVLGEIERFLSENLGGPQPATAAAAH